MEQMTADKPRADLTLAPFVTWHLFRPVALLTAEFSLYCFCVFCAVVVLRSSCVFGTTATPLL